MMAAPSEAGSARKSTAPAAPAHAMSAANPMNAHLNARMPPSRAPVLQAAPRGFKLTRRTLVLAVAAMAASPPARAQLPAVRPDAFVDLVDPYTEEARLAAPRHILPFTARYRQHGRRLTFVATRHDTERESPTFRAIARAFRQNPESVVLEGFPSAWGWNPPRMLSALRDAQRHGASDSYLRGEPGYAMSLAHARRIPFIGGEPEAAALNAALDGYARADIAGVKMLQWIPQGLIAGEFEGRTDPRFRQFLDTAAARVSADFTPPYPYTRAAYEDWHRAAFGIAVYDDEDYAARLDPSGAGPAARISRAMTLARDRHIFSVILGALSYHAHVLVVYGGAHFTTLHRALAAAMGRPSFS